MDLWKAERIPSIMAVMTPFPYSVNIDESIVRAEEIMRLHGVRHVPVEEDGEIVGIATQRDIGRLVNPALDASGRARIQVRRICVRDPYIVDLDERLDRVLLEMADRHLGSALVVRKGKLVGIFTVTDACRVLAQVLHSRFGPSGGGHTAA
jgi:acetoin utilization protein AcuB